MLTTLEISADWHVFVGTMMNHLMGKAIDQVGNEIRLQVWDDLHWLIDSQIWRQIHFHTHQTLRRESL